MSKIILSKNFISNTVKLALNEDLYPNGDITSKLIKNKKIIKSKIISNENALVAGIDFANHGVFGMLGYNIGTAKKRINFV